MTTLWFACLGMWKAIWTPPRPRPTKVADDYPHSELVRLRDEEEARQKDGTG